jgi:hypothetical protein
MRMFSTSLLLLLACPVLAGTPPAEEAGNPHIFLTRPESCPKCHARVPVTGEGGFVRDIVSLCQDCHIDDAMDHPVDVRPAVVSGLILPLDGDGEVTCATCHDPHASARATIPYVRQGVTEKLRRLFSAGGGYYPSFFLRRPNTRGELCAQCHDLANLARADLLGEDSPAGEYVGSDVCGGCHAEKHQEWRQTLHARTMADARKTTDALVARFEPGGRLRRDEVAFALGRHWTQRFLVERGGRLMVSREIWSVAEQKWNDPYWKEQDWGKLCAGCHVTGYDPYVGRAGEPGVGCEACHGPGGVHVEADGKGGIVNPARLTRDERDLICCACHTHGHDRTGEYRFPVGYAPGRDLGRYFRGLIPKPGQDGATFKNDGTLADRLRSFRYWTARYLMRRGVTCVLCKSYRAEDREEVDPRAPKEPDFTPAEWCLNCHQDLREGGRNHSVFRIEQRRCRECHPPMRDRDGAPSIHDHTFIFGGA